MTALTCTLPSQAQVSFGLKAGINISKVSFNEDVATATNRAGIFLGPQMDIDLPFPGLGADIAVLYDNKNVKFKSGKTTEKESLHYIDLPINVKYMIGLGRMSNIYFATGPQFSWNIGDTDILQDSYTLKSSQFSWNIGAGVTVLGRVRLGYTYNIACGNTAEVKGVSSLTDDFNFKNNTQQIHFTYLF